MDNERLSASANKVQQALIALNIQINVVELPASTKSARDAADAIGCRIEQIAKSLVFRGQQTDDPILVIASGRNRVDLNRLAQLAGERVVKPDAVYVRARTGFAIGGIPPIAHTEEIRTFIDSDLLQLDEIWAAAGTPHAVFRLRPQQLVAMTGGKVVNIAQSDHS